MDASQLWRGLLLVDAGRKLFSCGALNFRGLCPAEGLPQPADGTVGPNPHFTEAALARYRAEGYDQHAFPTWRMRPVDRIHRWLQGARCEESLVLKTGFSCDECLGVVNNLRAVRAACFCSWFVAGRIEPSWVPELIPFDAACPSAPALRSAVESIFTQLVLRPTVTMACDPDVLRWYLRHLCGFLFPGISDTAATKAAQALIDTVAPTAEKIGGGFVPFSLAAAAIVVLIEPFVFNEKDAADMAHAAVIARFMGGHLGLAKIRGAVERHDRRLAAHASSSAGPGSSYATLSSVALTEQSHSSMSESTPKEHSVTSTAGSPHVELLPPLARSGRHGSLGNRGSMRSVPSGSVLNSAGRGLPTVGTPFQSMGSRPNIGPNASTSDESGNQNGSHPSATNGNAPVPPLNWSLGSQQQHGSGNTASSMGSPSSPYRRASHSALGRRTSISFLGQGHAGAASVSMRPGSSVMDERGSCLDRSELASTSAVFGNTNGTSLNITLNAANGVSGPSGGALEASAADLSSAGCDDDDVRGDGANGVVDPSHQELEHYSQTNNGGD